MVTRTFWLTQYFVELGQEPAVPHPSAVWISDYLHLVEERAMTLPSDCSDGFAGCYWNRPERYLDPVVQAGMSVLARLSDTSRTAGTKRLADSLANGEWDERHGHLRDLHEFDMGYRLVICTSET